MFYFFFLILLLHTNKRPNKENRTWNSEYMHTGDGSFGLAFSLLASSATDHGFKSRSGQIGICCFSAMLHVHAEIRSKNKDWFAQYQDTVPDLFTCGLLFQ